MSLHDNLFHIDCVNMIKKRRIELNTSLCLLESILQKQKDNEVVVTVESKTSSFIIYNSLQNIINDVNHLIEKEKDNIGNELYKGYCVIS